MNKKIWHLVILGVVAVTLLLGISALIGRSQNEASSQPGHQEQSAGTELSDQTAQPGQQTSPADTDQATQQSPPANREQLGQQPSQSETITVTIEGLFTNKEVAISAEDTVLEILQSLDATDPEVRLTTEEYSGLGTLVESIGSITNGENDEYWQYRVNGVMPHVGADQLEVEAGDIIEWFFDTSEF